MSKYLRSGSVYSSQEGYALVAAFLILFLMTVLGIWAMYTSTAESRLSGNMSEEQLMFFFSEQGVDRIISHLHYKDQGLFSRINGLGYKFQDATTEILNPIQVLDNKQTLYFQGNSNVGENQLFRIDAWLDPQDYQHEMERNLSRPLAILVRVKNVRSEYEKAFRVTVAPKSIWDFAYYSLNHNPIQRNNYAGCNGASNTWYNCQTVFHGPTPIVVEGEAVLRKEDSITGDVYLRNASSSPDDTRFFVRGAPSVKGQVRWRSAAQFDLGSYDGTKYTGSVNQTAGGQSIINHPSASTGMVNQSRDVDMFDISYLTSWDTAHYRRNADIRIESAGPGYIWKIIFRNEIDTNEDNCIEEGRVGSAITTSTNNGSVDCINDDQGTFMLYRVPWSTQADVTCALYGNTMRRRHEEMTNSARNFCDASVNAAELWSPSATFSSKVSGSRCYDLRRNVGPSDHSYGPYDVHDIQGIYNFFYVPSQNRGLNSNCISGGSGNYNGIINIEGDVLVSGIIDGKVTLIVNGNAYIDHEIEKEDYNQDISCTQAGNCTYSSPDGVDMLGIFATGNIIIPNSRPKSYTHSWRGVYNDDFSDAENGRKAFVPSGNHDAFPLTDDDGTEDIHAVMVSFGYRPCTGTAQSLACPNGPTDAQIRGFQTGLFSYNRTSTLFNAGDGQPCCFDNQASGYEWIDQANDSGTLRIRGALIQNYPGRVGYDFYTSGGHWANSTCTGDSGTCHFIGHRLEIIYDNHLKYVMPAMPGATSPNRAIPYGRAAYEILSWQELNNTSLLGSNVW